MLNFQIVTLFPELFGAFQREGLVSRAVTEGQVRLSTLHLREFAINTHGQVDDSPYGGGSGMVMRVESGCAAIREAKKRDPGAKTILFTPRGKPLTQTLVRELLQEQSGFVLVCPRYEGVDERIVESEIDLEISLGDFILMGGEIPAQALIESMVRLLPGVLNNSDSIVHESFESGLLEYSQYTKPREFEGREVPEVLVSGNHVLIEKWREAESVSETEKRRPDLFTGPVRAKGEVSVALMHYPVLGKRGEIITSSLTNIDIHDIARSCKTYGISRFYIVHPVRALRKLAQKITDHWQDGFGATYNPTRKEALDLIFLCSDFDEALMDIEQRSGSLPKIIATSASKLNENIPYESLREKLLTDSSPHLILFGTGWGMAPELLSRADINLEPIVGPMDWNHLSVRAATAITLDRLFGGSFKGLRNY